jgi:hypothetical protein
LWSKILNKRKSNSHASKPGGANGPIMLVKTSQGPEGADAAVAYMQ